MDKKLVGKTISEFSEKDDIFGTLSPVIKFTDGTELNFEFGNCGGYGTMEIFLLSADKVSIAAKKFYSE